MHKYAPQNCTPKHPLEKKRYCYELASIEISMESEKNQTGLWPPFHPNLVSHALSRGERPQTLRTAPGPDSILIIELHIQVERAPECQTSVGALRPIQFAPINPSSHSERTQQLTGMYQ